MRVRGDAPHGDLCPSNDGSPGPVDCDFCERLYSADARGYTRGWSAGYEQGQRDERDRIRRGVMWLPMVGRLAGTDSTLSALHVLAVIDGADAVDEIGGYSFDEATTMAIAAIDAPCDCGTCRAIAADRLTRGKGSS